MDGPKAKKAQKHDLNIFKLKHGIQFLRAKKAQKQELNCLQTRKARKQEFNCLQAKKSQKHYLNFFFCDLKKLKSKN